MFLRKLRHTALLVLCALLAAACAPTSSLPAREASAPGSSQGGQAPLLVQESLRARRHSVPAVLLYQLPELPNGCEATSLAMLLESYGIAASKTELAYQYLPRAEFYEENGAVYGPAPEEAYAGETLRALDLTGTGPAGLERLLCEGRPVIVWGTLQFEPPRQSTTHSWLLTGTGEEYIPYSNLHCMLLYGYDEEFYYLCDPLYGYQAVEKAKFVAIYGQMGRRAMALDAPSAMPARMAE